MALANYELQTRRLLHDPNAQAYSTTDIDAYINLARNQVAIEGECVHVVLSGGTITQLTINSGGTGYSGTATVTFTGPGAQAFATATIGGGAISTLTFLRGGWGYIPDTNVVVTATGSTGGTNATFNVQVSQAASTVTGQETVLFSTLNTLLSAWNTSTAPPADATIGASQVIKIFSIACNQQGTFKPMLTQKVWSEFQAFLRIYANTQQNYPVYWAQLGQGVAGSIYLFPWPAQPLQLDIQACATVIPLVNDSTPEALPYPWTDAVPYFAAYLAYTNSSRADDAQRMFQIYEIFMKRARAMSEGPFMTDWYGYEY